MTYPKINPQGPVPINQQIANWMRNNIQSGLWKENHQLIAETQLAKNLNVSRGTVRKAIETLIAEKLLIRRHGKGTFVNKRVILQHNPYWRLSGFSRDLISQGIPYSTEVLLKEIIRPDREIAHLLKIEQHHLIYHMQRLRKIKNQPVLLIENHIIYDRCQGVEKIDYNRKQFYTTLENQFQIQFSWARRTYQATTADKSLSNTLDLKTGSSLMYLEELYHDEKDEPVEYTRAWIDGEIFHITTTIRRQDEKRETPGIYR